MNMNKRNAYALMFENFSLVFPFPALCVVCSDWLSVSGYTVDMPSASFPLNEFKPSHRYSTRNVIRSITYFVLCIHIPIFQSSLNPEAPYPKASDLVSCYTFPFKPSDSSTRSQSSNPWHSAGKSLGICSLCNGRGNSSIQIGPLTF
jgi:hypothetical protein